MTNLQAFSTLMFEIKSNVNIVNLLNLLEIYDYFGLNTEELIKYISLKLKIKTNFKYIYK